MREYNFPVHGAPGGASDVLFRLVLDTRFSAADMLADYPRNMVQPFLDIVVGHDKHPARFKATGPNTIEGISPTPTRVSDAERAILTNLMDFGQDFESPRSTTISELVFPLDQPSGQGPAHFLKALARRNAEAVAFMNEVMSQFPPEDEYSTRTWPEELVERYYFGIVIDYADALGEADITRALRVLDCLHDVNLWNGFTATGLDQFFRRDADRQKGGHKLVSDFREVDRQDGPCMVPDRDIEPARPQLIKHAILPVRYRG